MVHCWLHGAARLPSANVTPSLWNTVCRVNTARHGNNALQQPSIPFPSSNTSSSLLLFTHSSFSLITILYLALSSCRISSHLILPLFLYRSLSSHHLSRRCRVDTILQSRPCIPVFFHTSTSSVTLQHLETTQNKHPSPPATLVDLRPSRPAFQQNHYVFCTRRSTFWDILLAHNDSLNHTTAEDDHAFPHLIPGALRAPRLRARQRPSRRCSCRS